MEMVFWLNPTRLVKKERKNVKYFSCRAHIYWDMINFHSFLTDMRILYIRKEHFLNINKICILFFLSKYKIPRSIFSKYYPFLVVRHITLFLKIKPLNFLR